MKTGIIGLGLIGGSLARTIRRHYPDCTIAALNRSEGPLKKALAEGVADITMQEAGEGLRDCDFIFLCAPVETNKKFLSAIKPYITEKTILTDAGSVKGVIHEAVKELLPEAHFIGGHPMAGSEKSGYDNSSDNLFENAYYILTPSDKSGEEELERYKKFVAGLGAIPLVMDHKVHDLVTAAVSHVPHLIAYSLVELIRREDGPEEYMRTIAAGGFKDITRIAGSDPVMWSDICSENRDDIIKVTDKYIEVLKDFKGLVEKRQEAELKELFGEVREYRSSFAHSSPGPLKKEHDLYCDIRDETGAIAGIATLLSEQGISIKNIGIVHNRSFEKGALHVGFYNDDALEKAGKVLKDRGFIVHTI